MANVNYNNPTAVMPSIGWQPQGPLAGYMWNQREDEFREQTGLQKMAQGMDLEKQRMSLDELKQGAPLRAMQQQLQQETIQGQMPHARNLASSGALHTMAGQQFDRDTKFSEPAKQSFFSDLRAKTNDNQWKQYQREIQMGYDIASQAMNIAEKQGQTAAMAYAMQMAEKNGLPTEAFANPAMWPQLRDAALHSAEQMRAVELETIKGNFAQQRTQTAADATRDAARTSAAARPDPSERPLSRQQEIATMRRDIQRMTEAGQRPSDAMMERYGQAIEGEWNDYKKDDPALTVLFYKAVSNNKEVADDAAQKIDQERKKFFARFGVNPRGAAPQQQQSQPQQQQAPANGGWSIRSLN